LRTSNRSKLTRGRCEADIVDATVYDRLGSNSEKLTARINLPLCPENRTLLKVVGTSEMGEERALGLPLASGT
jgi:hypothetical protein